MTGVPGAPNVFYMAAVNGGIWKTTDAGRVWKPIFDGQATGSIGAVAVAPSDPQTIYAGSGEGLQRPDLSTGDGFYRSTDGGVTWSHLGLRDAQQISRIVVDPHDAKRLFVAVLGHPYGPNTERGVYRSTDGGVTFEKILYKSENAGAIELVMDPSDSQTLYAELWSARRAPWTSGSTYTKSDLGTALYKSTDGGATWQTLTRGLPTQAQGLGRIGLSISRSDPKRIYAAVDAPQLGGIYRSDDAGASWQRTNDEPRVWGRGDDFAGVCADPKDRDVVYMANTSTYRSTDAGKTFTAIKGAPGGDDYHTIWINPENPDIIALGVDQGATISVNHGATWSSWYNQATAQFYHVSTDNRFPYWVYGGQQESGSAGVASRGNDGDITFREFHPVGTEEYGYVAPDPLHPNIIYGGKVHRFDWTTMQTQDVSPVVVRGPDSYRFNRTAPLLFSPADPHALYLGSNVVFRTRNGGHSWDIVSPDLTRADPGVPPTFAAFTDVDPAKGKHRGVIYSLSPSYRDAKLIWAGTDDGLMWVTRDGGVRWSNVTPKDLGPWNKVAQIDASHFDSNTAYIAVNKFRLDDLHAYIFRTHDGGKSWAKITSGLPDDAAVNTVREDPIRRGLLYAGTERTVYVSFDDGDHWQSLQLDLPSTSIRDLVVHGDDLVVGTHGRSFWILTDIAPLREHAAALAATAPLLFAPQRAYRIMRNTNTDTPLPPEEPAGENPPDGAIIDYLLPEDRGPVTLDILDTRGTLLRRYSSTDPVEPVETDLNVPTYWVRPARVLQATPGAHRFVWDIRTEPPRAIRHEYPISAIYRNTPREPLGPSVVPGTYTVRLLVGGLSLRKPLVITLDPRVSATTADLRAQYAFATTLAAAMTDSFDAVAHARAVRKQLQDTAKAQPGAPVTDAMAGANRELAALLDGPAALPRLHAQVSGIYSAVNGPDAAPTVQQLRAFADMKPALRDAAARWIRLRDNAVPKLNAFLRAKKLAAIDVRRKLPFEEDAEIDEP